MLTGTMRRETLLMARLREAERSPLGSPARTREADEVSAAQGPRAESVMRVEQIRVGQPAADGEGGAE